MSSDKRPATCGRGLLAVLAVGLTLRLTNITESLSGDEVFSLQLAGMPWKMALEASLQDLVHPPLYYVVLKLSAGLFGTHPVALRALSVSFDLLVVALTLVLGRASLGTFPGLLAASLVALNDAQIFYGREIRSYSLYAFLVLAVIGAVWRASARPREKRGWITFGLTATLVAYTHYVGWLYILSTLPAAWLRGGRLAVLGWLRSTIMSGLLFLPWALALIPRAVEKGGLDQNLGWISQPSVVQLGWTLSVFVGVLPVPRGMTISLLLIAILTVAGITYGASHDQTRSGGRSATGSLSSQAHPRAPRGSALILFASAAFLPPLLLYFLASPLTLPIWGTRHLLPSQAPLSLIVAGGVAVFGLRARPLGVAMAAIVLLLQLSPTVVATDRPRLMPYNEVAAWLLVQPPPQDPILTTSPHSIGLPLDYYMRPEWTIEPLPLSDSHLPGIFWLVYRPGIEAEQERYESLIEAGWNPVAVKEFRPWQHAARSVGVVRMARRRAGGADSPPPK